MRAWGCLFSSSLHLLVFRFGSLVRHRLPLSTVFAGFFAANRFAAGSLADGFSAGGFSHRIPDPNQLGQILGRVDHLQKNLATSGHFGPLRQRRRRHGALRQWLFHPPVTQARLRHPTPCP